MSPSTETITLAGGCFWCLEAVYEQVEGVLAVESGYSNGHVVNPSYEQVCRGGTGHAEVVRVQFDVQRLSLREVLEVFFSIHDPTTRDRQGNDIGPQYRSGIYFESPQQEALAREVITQVQTAYRAPVLTEVLPLANYSRAEADHQHYFARNPRQGYCAFVVAPKLAGFRRNFARLVRRP